jgi:inorganic phosphate transporter, PiT family
MTLLLVIIILALVFDYINGFHDAANSIATIVSTKVLTPLQAVLWAAFFNVIAFLIFKDHAVANTIAKTVKSDFITLPVIFSGLIAAIMWNLLTWWYGIPSSSSHTLIGGFAGAAVTHAFMQKGFIPLASIVDSSKILKTVAFIFLAPLLGMLISMFFTLVTINRNIWLKTAILLASCVGLWFLFQNFQETKLNENIAKYFKVQKYQDVLDKNEGSTDPKKIKIYEETVPKLAEAKENAAAAKKYTAAYEKEGATTVINNITSNLDLKNFEISLLKDKVKKYLEVDRLKILSSKDESKKGQYEAANAGYDSIIPVLKKYHSLAYASTNSETKKAYYDTMIAQAAIVYPMSANEITAFKKVVNVNVQKDLASEINKADNHFLRYFMIGGLLIFIAAFWWTEKLNKPSAARSANMYKKLQLMSSAAFSVGHGGNDAQKVMGIISAALVANGDIVDIKNMPTWVPAACYIAIGLGTLSGGWKIVKTMGSKITKVTPLEGVCAETAGATTLFLTEQMGIPVSTTHTITGSIIGVGATKRLSAVRWGVTLNLVWAWILTIPVSATLAGLVYFIVQFFVK